MTNTQLNDLII